MEGCFVAPASRRLFRDDVTSTYRKVIGGARRAPHTIRDSTNLISAPPLPEGCKLIGQSIPAAQGDEF